eukprot:m51a1_g11200 putative dna ligase 1-like (970) ;mRNA; r:15615-19317
MARGAGKKTTGAPQSGQRSIASFFGAAKKSSEESSAAAAHNQQREQHKTESPAAAAEDKQASEGEEQEQRAEERQEQEQEEHEDKGQRQCSDSSERRECRESDEDNPRPLKRLRKAAPPAPAPAPAAAAAAASAAAPEHQQQQQQQQQGSATESREDGEGIANKAKGNPAATAPPAEIPASSDDAAMQPPAPAPAAPSETPAAADALPCSSDHSRSPSDSSSSGSSAEAKKPCDTAQTHAPDEHKGDDDDGDDEDDEESDASSASGSDSDAVPDDGDDDDEAPAAAAAAAPRKGASGKAKAKAKPKTKAEKKAASAVPPHNPVTDAIWKEGEAVPYLALARTLAAVEGTTLRLVKVELLANLLRSVVRLTPGDLVAALYLVVGKVAPDFAGVELGVGESILVKAICNATGRTPDRLKADLREQGDLGKVAAAAKQNTRTMFPPPPLTVRGVFKTLKEIATSGGQASRNKKLDLIQRLLVSCRESEAQYLIRTLQGKFRIGCSEKTVLVALARAVVQTPPLAHLAGSDPVLDARKTLKAGEFEEAVERTHEAVVKALSEVPSFDEVVPVLVGADGVAELSRRCTIRPGMPVKPMLAQPTKGIGEVLTRLESIGYTCEYKYDGERAQVHMLGDGSIKIFSRNLEDNTQKFPDLQRAVPPAVSAGVQSFIIDSEAVAWDRANKKLLPFQVLSHRARKTVEVEDVKIQVCVFAFDLLYLNGKSLLHETLKRRRELLRETFKEIPGQFVFATHKDITDSADIQPFLQEAVENQCEGLMVKAYERQSEYVPNSRSYNWLKIKKDYMEGMTDSVDLVPIAAWFGTGKRTGWYGAYLIACYDDDGECYQAMTKVATGLSDDDLRQHYEFFKDKTLPGPRPYYSIGEGMKQPDVWLDAVQVWEVKGADLTISPAYTAAAGLVDKTKGVSLRFPRFLRIRDDKTPENATNAAQVAELYRKQSLCISSGPKKPAAFDDDD